MSLALVALTVGSAQAQDRRPTSVRAGAQNLVPGRTDLEKPSLSEALNDCRDKDARFECVHRTALMAAVDYERKAEERQRLSDASTFVAGVGLAGVLIGTGHATSTSLRYWTAGAALPIATDDLTQFAPRARLYGISAGAMNRLAAYYDELDAALDEPMTDPHIPLLGQACRDVDIIKSIAKTLTKIEQAAVEPQVTGLVERCARLASADTALRLAEQAWPDTLDLSSRFALDVKLLDARITEFDRGFRSRPSETIGVVLASPFELVGKILKGESRTGDFKSLNRQLFDKPYQAPLARLAPATLPEPVGPELALLGGPRVLAEEAAAGAVEAGTRHAAATTRAQRAQTSAALLAAQARQIKADDLNARIVLAVRDLNAVSGWSNQRLGRLRRIKAAAEHSVLVLDFKTQEQAIQMKAPAP